MGNQQPCSARCGFSVWNDPFPDVRTRSHLNLPKGGPPQRPRETVPAPEGICLPGRGGASKHTACQTRAAGVRVRSPPGPFRIDDPHR